MDTTLAPSAQALLDGKPAIVGALLAKAERASALSAGPALLNLSVTPAQDAAYREGWATSPFRGPMSPEMARRKSIDLRVDDDLVRMKKHGLMPFEIDAILGRVRAILECSPSTDRSDRIEDETIADVARFALRLNRTMNEYR